MVSIRLAAEALEAALDGFEPARCSGADAASLVTVLARVERRCAVARVRAANRAAECGAHRDAGFQRPSDWLGREAGQDPARARRDMETAKKAEEHAATKDALDRGEVSLDEAEQITKSPDDADELLDVAKGHDMRKLKERARRRAQERDRDELGERRRKARGIRAWTDDMGMVCGSFSLLPELGVPFLARLKAEAERRWRVGHRADTTEQRMHDALFTLLGGRGEPSTPRTELMVVWNLNENSFRIPGVGPIDPEVAKDIAKDAFVTGVIHDGVDVKHYQRFGKYVPRELQVLLEMGDPPHFEGMRCADCSATFAFQRDHVDPRANGGETSLANLEPRCPPCHRAKTERDREAGLLGPTPKRPPRRKAGATAQPQAGAPERARAP